MAEDRWDVLNRWMGSIDAKMDNIEKQVYSLPCRKHSEDLAALKVKSGAFGAIGALVVVLPVLLWKKITE